MKKVIYYLVLCFCIACGLDSNKKEEPYKKSDMRMRISMGGRENANNIFIEKDSIFIFKCKLTSNDSCEQFAIALNDEELKDIYNCINNVITNFEFSDADINTIGGEHLTFSITRNKSHKTVRCVSETIIKSQSFSCVKHLKELINSKLDKEHRINWLNG